MEDNKYILPIKDDKTKTPIQKTKLLNKYNLTNKNKLLNFIIAIIWLLYGLMFCFGKPNIIVATVVAFILLITSIELRFGVRINKYIIYKQDINLLNTNKKGRPGRPYPLNKFNIGKNKLASLWDSLIFVPLGAFTMGVYELINIVIKHSNAVWSVAKWVLLAGIIIGLIILAGKFYHKVNEDWVINKIGRENIE